MDEMWQRHKTFIVQLIVGGVIFLVAFFVMRGMYGDENDPETVRKRNESRKVELEGKLSKEHAPSQRSIDEQRSIAAAAEAQKWSLAKRVASVVGRDAKTSEADREKAYVSENIDDALAKIGRPDDGFKALYDRVPQAGLTRLRDAVRSVLVSKAAQSGKEIDETLGLGGGFPEDEIPEALHGLAIATDVISRSLAKPGIEKVQSVRISARTTFPENNGVNFVSGIAVHLEIVGDPADVNDVIRSFNAVGKSDRMIVLESVEYVVPISTDEDTVKAAINVVGLRLKSTDKAEGP